MDQQKAKQIKITTEPVHKLVCEYAVPSIVCMLISNIYNLVDTAFVGRLDTQSTAAIGIVLPFMTLIQSFSFFFGHGSGNFISRALGGGKTDDASTMAAAGFFSALFLSLVIGVFGAAFMTPVLKFLGSTQTILPVAKGYFLFIMLGAPFISLSIVLNNQMRHQGNAKMSMYGILSGAVLNMILDPIFIFALKMGVAGAGLATAISQCVSCLIMLELSGRNGGIKISHRAFKMNWTIFKDINAGGLPSLTRQSLMCLAAIVLNNFSNNYGDEAVAAFSIVNRVIMFSSAIVLGFGQGFQPVCGFNYGAGLYDRVRNAFWFTIRFDVIYCAILSFIGIVFAPSIIKFFRAEDLEVVRIGAKVLRYQCAAFTLVGFILPVNMFLQTIRRTVPAVVVAGARQGIFLIPFLFIFHAFLGLDGIILAQPIADLCCFLLCVPFASSALKDLKSKQ